MNPTELFLSILIKEARKQVASDRWPAITFIKEHRTVRLGLPRQSGKTSAAVEIAGRSPSLVISPKKQMCDAAIAMGLPLIKGRTIAELHPHLVVEDSIEIMLVDEGFMLPEQEVNKVFDFATDLWLRGKLNQEKFVLVFIGT